MEEVHVDRDSIRIIGLSFCGEPDRTRALLGSDSVSGDLGRLGDCARRTDGRDQFSVAKPAGFKSGSYLLIVESACIKDSRAKSNKNKNSKKSDKSKKSKKVKLCRDDFEFSYTDMTLADEKIAENRAGIANNLVLINEVGAIADQNSTSITSEASLRHDADVILRNSIAEQAFRRESADSILQNNILAESRERAAADSTLQLKLDIEKSQRTSADTVQQAEITSEIDSRISADEELDSRIDKEIDERTADNLRLENDIKVESDARLDADIVLKDNLVTEIMARESAVVDLDADIQNEIDERIAADDTLQISIEDEASIRAAADDNLLAEIESEQSARIAADDQLRMSLDALGLRVDGLENRIVENYIRIVSILDDETGLAAEVAANATAISDLSAQHRDEVEAINAEIIELQVVTIPNLHHELNGEIAILTAAINGDASDIGLIARVANLLADVSSLASEEGRVTSLEDDLNALDELALDLQNQLSALEVRITQTEDDIVGLTTMVESLGSLRSCIAAPADRNCVIVGGGCWCSTDDTYTSGAAVCGYPPGYAGTYYSITGRRSDHPGSVSNGDMARSIIITLGVTPHPTYCAPGSTCSADCATNINQNNGAWGTSLTCWSDAQRWARGLNIVRCTNFE